MVKNEVLFNGFYTALTASFICDLRKILFLTIFNTKFPSPEIVHKLQVSG